MTTKITLSAAQATLAAEYRAAIETAAKNSVLSPKEQDTLSSWADRTLDKYRVANPGTLATKDAYLHVEAKVRSALKAVSSDQKHITASDAKKLFVTELRAKALDLFTPNNTDTKTLAKAIDAANDHQEMEDYNKGFAFKEFPASSTLSEVVEEMTGDSQEDFWPLKKGAGGVAKWVAQAMSQGDDELDSHVEDGEDALGKEMKAEHYAVANAASALFGDTTKFKTIYQHHNHASDDNGIEWSVLFGQRNDGSWAALVYSNNPF